MAVHQGRRSRQLTIRSVYWQKQATASFTHNTYVYILYLKHEDAIILSTGLPISTTVVGQWLNSLLFHDNITCIKANVQTVIYVHADLLSHESFILRILFGKHYVILNITL